MITTLVTIRAPENEIFNVRRKFAEIHVLEMKQQRKLSPIQKIVSACLDVTSIIYRREMISAHNGMFPIPSLIRTRHITVKYIML